MDTLGARLNYARRKRGYTQNSLAEEIGVSRGVIYNLEKDMTSPQPIVINAICQTLKISQNWLMTGDGEMEDKRAASRSARVLAELYELAKELSEEEQLYILDVIKAFRQRLGGHPGTPEE